MAYQAAGQPRWFLDRGRDSYFYHDARTDEYVYQDGRRVPVPRPSASTPRTADVLSRSQQSPASQYHYPGPPPQNRQYPYRQQAPQAPIRESTRSSTESQPNFAGLTPAASNVLVGSPSSWTYDLSGIQIVEAQNPQSLVTTRFGTSPANRITDPALYNSGVRAHRMLYGTGGSDVEQLYSNYRIRQHNFFSVGRVFLILWVEPAGDAGSVVTNVEPSDQAVTIGAFNERVFSKVRRFIVIREGETYCSALPIASYGGRGVSKPNVKKSEHAIVHTSREAPQPKTHENPLRGEAGMRPIPIRITPDDPREALDPMSRLDFGKVHTIQHNMKVRPFGNVHPSSSSALLTQFSNVWSNTTTPARASGTSQSSQSGRATASSSTGKPRMPPSVASSNSRRRQYTVDATPADDESDESDESEEDEDEDRDGEEDDVSSNARSSRGKKPSVPPQRRNSSSSASAGRSSWEIRVQQARSAVARLLEQGYTREQAFASFVARIQSQGKPREVAQAEVRALLTGSSPAKRVLSESPSSTPQKLASQVRTSRSPPYTASSTQLNNPTSVSEVTPSASDREPVRATNQDVDRFKETDTSHDTSGTTAAQSAQVLDDTIGPSADHGPENVIRAENSPNMNGKSDETQDSPFNGLAVSLDKGSNGKEGQVVDEHNVDNEIPNKSRNDEDWTSISDLDLATSNDNFSLGESYGITESLLDDASKASWALRAQQARGAVSRLIDKGYTREAAFAQLRGHYESRGKTQDAAHAEAKALLTGTPSLI